MKKYTIEEFKEFLVNNCNVGQLTDLLLALSEEEMDKYASKRQLANSELRIGEDNICPMTKEICLDECCPPGAICNLSGEGLIGDPDVDYPEVNPYVDDFRLGEQGEHLSK
jgi:hypothetical protein